MLNSNKTLVIEFPYPHGRKINLYFKCLEMTELVAELKEESFSVPFPVPVPCYEPTVIIKEEPHAEETHPEENITDSERFNFDDALVVKDEQYIDPLRQKFACDQCQFVTTQASKLKEHIFAVHEGIRHPCDQCDYTATYRQSLKEHKDSIHNGIRYPCSHCSDVFTKASSLKIHVKSKHEGVKHPCNQCDFVATLASSLKVHIKSKHQGIRLGFIFS